MLWPRDPPPSGFDRSANFWEKMAPHFDYQSESVAVVVDGNMAQAFTKDCAPAETHDESLVLSWPTGEGETVSRVWHPWEDAGKNSMGFCVNAFELPNDARPPIRIRTAQAFHIGNHLYLGEQALARFEDGFDGWLLEGEAITNHNQHERYGGQQPISGNAGRGFLTSYHPDTGDRPTGRALSPAFTASPGQYLAFLIAGGRGDGVGARLLADGEETAVWQGENTERFQRVVYPLAEVAGQRLQLELFDDESGGWGHIMLDQVMLARRQSDSSPVRFETMSDSDYLIRLTGGDLPVIRSDWDVYLVGNSLIYKKEQCTPEDAAPMFFLHLVPVDAADLPSHRKQNGFDNLDFVFRDHRLVERGVCVARRELPDYAVAAIRTGQFTGEDQIWNGSFDVVAPADDGNAAR